MVRSTGDVFIMFAGDALVLTRAGWGAAREQMLCLAQALRLAIVYRKGLLGGTSHRKFCPAALINVKFLLTQKLHAN
jgi:hypothetical protein